jgi:hypothetical protein
MTNDSLYLLSHKILVHRKGKGRSFGYIAGNLDKSSFLSPHSPFFANSKDTLRQYSQFKKEKAE